ncbi:hypothetical protein R3P38DRAFT_3262816 [Favolaschia claudopus]|uniref:Uncharacterized protein n=1 Tax=Favolaschia claudopus TaxID=2862362 RepID=A0AAW0CI61_9AGAR
MPTAPGAPPLSHPSRSTKQEHTTPQLSPTHISPRSPSLDTSHPSKARNSSPFWHPFQHPKTHTGIPNDEHKHPPDARHATRKAHNTCTYLSLIQARFLTHVPNPSPRALRSTKDGESVAAAGRKRRRPLPLVQSIPRALYSHLPIPIPNNDRRRIETRPGGTAAAARKPPPPLSQPPSAAHAHTLALENEGIETRQDSTGATATAKNRHLPPTAAPSHSRHPIRPQPASDSSLRTQADDSGTTAAARKSQRDIPRQLQHLIRVSSTSLSGNTSALPSRIPIRLKSENEDDSKSAAGGEAISRRIHISASFPAASVRSMHICFLSRSKEWAAKLDIDIDVGSFGEEMRTRMLTSL